MVSMPFFLKYSFQSTPPARGATLSWPRRRSRKSNFNPRPPRGGRHPALQILAQKGGISIHAPREGGDIGMELSDQYFDISIHAPREGGDVAVSSAFSIAPYFNPRPPRGGRRYVARMPALIDRISIHAPREGGDARNLQKLHLLRHFNPRPPRGGRHCGARGANPTSSISIHAPREGGDAFPGARPGRLCISIHAPREGGDLLDVVSGPRRLGISIHAPREGGDVGRDDGAAFREISIHAPREGGDETPPPPVAMPPIFQSTPPARGATCSRSMPRSILFYFNPRPPRGGRQQRCTVLPADL